LYISNEGKDGIPGTIHSFFKKWSAVVAFDLKVVSFKSLSIS
jgi:hypothetical protein